MALALVLTGCTATTAREDSSASAEVSQQELLGSYDLEGMDAVEVTGQLDRLDCSDRPTDLNASVTPDHLVLTSSATELAMPLPDDAFYLSVAPYVSQTHECFYHSLATCQRELSNAEVQVTVVDEFGEVLVKGHTTTFDNGFVSVWVPRETQGTIEISYDGMTGSTEFTATEDEATCITDLQVA